MFIIIWSVKKNDPPRGEEGKGWGKGSKGRTHQARRQEGRQEEGASRHLPVSIFLFFIFIFTIFSYSLLTEASPLSVSPEILSMVWICNPDWDKKKGFPYHKYARSSKGIIKGSLNTINHAKSFDVSFQQIDFLYVFLWIFPMQYDMNDYDQFSKITK